MEAVLRTTSEVRRDQIEGRAGVESIDTLLAERYELVKRAAPLAAVYGPFGTWEARRKAVLAAANLDVRTADKMTEAHIDARSRCHPTYLAFLETSEREKAEWIELDNAIQSITERINRDHSLLRFATAELTLQR